jgi:hypothetical protein
MASRKKQLSREEIHALRGKFKLNLGDKSFCRMDGGFEPRGKGTGRTKISAARRLGQSGKMKTNG